MFKLLAGIRSCFSELAFLNEEQIRVYISIIFSSLMFSVGAVLLYSPSSLNLFTKLVFSLSSNEIGSSGFSFKNIITKIKNRIKNGHKGSRQNNK